MLPTLFTAVTASNAAAIECYSESPTVRTGGNVFDYQEAEVLSSSERKTLQAFLKKIDRNWQGSSSRVTCVGNEKNVRQVTKDAEASLEIDGDYRRELNFRAEIYDPERKARYREGFRLYQTDGFLLIDSRGPDGNIELIGISPGEMVFLQRYFIPKRRPPEPKKPEDKPTILPLLPDLIGDLLPSIQPVDMSLPEKDHDTKDIKNKETVKFRPAVCSTKWFAI